MISFQQFDAENAVDIVTLGRDARSDTPNSVVLLDDTDEVAHVLDRELALAVAERIQALALQLPEPPRLIKRVVDTETHLRALD
ncbi:hypothetical protein GCM10022219_11540 [Microbacterium oryzae]|uniref:Uncharacterized protein n=1 Tax=Microbacterium oryzae TaxID=743009 RepID=A0A6I6E2S1_9MICO|nr:hypothetical protein [Microbacterium oryzae]QGU28474.1 hypothetical protein D7D94_12930 [Microbacterium oryzae]